MVGEVQAVIRDLATTGKTLMIVTHEMAFARAICNRVFYMDEGGIYEDGTPEQVFDNPLRENTRRFVRRLKVLELSIASRDYDFLGMMGEIDKYCRKNQIAPRQNHRIQLAFEEITQQLVKQLEHPRIEVVIEYSETTENATLVAQYNSPSFDATQADDKLAKDLLYGISSQVDCGWNEGAELPNQIRVTIEGD